MTSTRRHLSAFAALALTAMVLPLTATSVAAESGATVPAGFRDELVWGSLPDHPMVVAFAPSGKVFVALKGGVINEYDSLTDTSATQLVNLSSEVHNYWDRGLMGMVVDPQFPTRPYVYALYAYDHQLGDPARRRSGATPCPSPNPGGNTDGCMISGKLVRLTTNAAGTAVTGTTTPHRGLVPAVPEPLARQPRLRAGRRPVRHRRRRRQLQRPGLRPARRLASAGRPSRRSTPAATRRTRAAPCAPRTSARPATRLGLDGTVLRIDPDTGAAWPDNANFGSGERQRPEDHRLRPAQPLPDDDPPATARSGSATSGSPTGRRSTRSRDPDAAPRNFGWPCREGNVATPEYSGLDLPLCDSLVRGRATGLHLRPRRHRHRRRLRDRQLLDLGDRLPHDRRQLPEQVRQRPLLRRLHPALHLVRARPRAATATPDFTSIEQFANLRRSGDTPGRRGLGRRRPRPATSSTPTTTARRSGRSTTTRRSRRTPSFTATPTSGPAPLDVDFDASGSSDPNGDPITAYKWDFDGDGQFDDDTGVAPSHTFNTVGNVTVGLQVTAGRRHRHRVQDHQRRQLAARPDHHGAVRLADLGRGRPAHVQRATRPTSRTETLAASKFTWTLAVEHCPSDCHEHIIETRTGVTSGTFNAPDHDYPSYVRIYLRVTDSGGLSTTVHRDFQPKTGTIDAVSSPAGITLGVGGRVGRAAAGRDRASSSRTSPSPRPRTQTDRRGHLHVQQVVRRRRPQPPGGRR